jgi:aspartate/methionine/tyrosine aminotransferase
MPPDDMPVPTVPEAAWIPRGSYLRDLTAIPPSRMFLINKGLDAYRARHPDSQVFDASQGDGGASLPGVPPEVLEQAFALQSQHGSAYDMPYGTDSFRRSVAESYWNLDSSSGWGPANVVAAAGGRDALVKAYSAMLAMGHGSLGDWILVSRVPWISYTWGPYGVGANVLLAPGRAEEGWAITPEAVEASVTFAEASGRKVAGLIITSPDNPTGRALTAEQQVDLARAALRTGVAFVLFDWMYHYVTDGQPMDLNAFLSHFDVAERKRLIFMDGITKSLGASNVRNAHLIADADVIRFIVARASHSVLPSFFSMAVAMAAYEMGYARATAGIREPTNRSRKLLADFIAEHQLRAILGQGYYAFVDVTPWLQRIGWADTERLGQTLAEDHGVAVVPGIYFSPFGGSWVRFSYATPPDRTVGAARRLLEGLDALAGG